MHNLSLFDLKYSCISFYALCSEQPLCGLLVARASFCCTCIDDVKVVRFACAGRPRGEQPPCRGDHVSAGAQRASDQHSGPADRR